MLSSFLHGNVCTDDYIPVANKQKKLNRGPTLKSILNIVITFITAEDIWFLSGF